MIQSILHNSDCELGSLRYASSWMYDLSMKVVYHYATIEGRGKILGGED